MPLQPLPKKTLPLQPLLLLFRHAAALQHLQRAAAAASSSAAAAAASSAAHERADAAPAGADAAAQGGAGSALCPGSNRACKVPFGRNARVSEESAGVAGEGQRPPAVPGRLPSASGHGGAAGVAGQLASRQSVFDRLSLPKADLAQPRKGGSAEAGFEAKKPGKGGSGKKGFEPKQPGKGGAEGKKRRKHKGAGSNPSAKAQKGTAADTAGSQSRQHRGAAASSGGSAEADQASPGPSAAVALAPLSGVASVKKAGNRRIPRLEVVEEEPFQQVVFERLDHVSDEAAAEAASGGLQAGCYCNPPRCSWQAVKGEWLGPTYRLHLCKVCKGQESAD